MSRVSAGPFYQFQNMDDSEADLTKLVHQLARLVPGLELDADVVKVQVATFKTTEAEILKKINTPAGRKGVQDPAEDNPVAKLVEEMKALPSRVAERLAESEEPFLRRRKLRRFHPLMLEEMMEMMDMAGEPGDPVGILLAASVVRDDAPWLYELAMEVYRAVKSRDPAAIGTEMARLQRFSEFTTRSPFLEEFGFGGKESYIFVREFPRMLHHMLSRMLEDKKPHPRRRTPRSQASQP